GGVHGVARWATVSAGSTHSCALLADGTAKCWGLNGSGQLGNNTTTNASTPVVVSGLGAGTNVVAVSAGGNHTCALLGDGTAKCWGANAFGQLGNGTTTNSSTPVVVTGLAGAVALSAGENHTCALLAGGTAKCWGANAFGQVGNGTTTHSSTPAVVTGLADG